MDVFVRDPWLTAIPCAIFLALYAMSRRSVVLAAAIAWLVYLLYEYAMKRRILCSGECNIRVDLFLVYPALLVLSLVAAVAVVRYR
jgi:hypothetical protein